jgi:myo-inositol-hexaphosphate 3-phosphohydrolase
LWIPSDSPYISNKEWLDVNFPRNERYHSALYVAEDGDNILTPEAMIQMLELHKKVVGIQVDNSTWNDLCYK